MSADAIDANAIEVVGGSPDVRSWPVTATIRGVELTPGELRFTADVPAWPHVTPPGWDGGIQSTLWIVVKRGGQWRSTGSIEFYETRKGTGSPLSSGLADWWYYAPEIGQPQPGETVGLFIAAGDQRRKDVRSVEERSNIVTFTVPPNDTGVFSFDAPAGHSGIVVPANGGQAAGGDASSVAAQLTAIQKAVADEAAKAEAFRQEARQFFKDALKAIKK
jgi:hypothetical protein